jgi:L-ascorbate metabolism protein UlaG (beta-lactamase superfamily)
MKRTILFFLFVSLVMIAGCTPAATTGPTPTPTTQDILDKLHFFGSAAFLYHGTKTIYFDPVNLDGNLPPADLILVTHGHNDHMSVNDIKKVIGPKTTLIISPNVSSTSEALQNELGIPVKVLAEGETTKVKGVKVEAVPAYDTSFHPRQAGGVGYIVSVDGLRIYHAGGTAAYPEMAQYSCDVALIPAYSKDQVQAIAEIVPAKVTVIMHTSYYGAQAYIGLFSQNIGGGKTFAAMQPGPYNP